MAAAAPIGTLRVLRRLKSCLSAWVALLFWLAPTGAIAAAPEAPPPGAWVQPSVPSPSGEPSPALWRVWWAPVADPPISDPSTSGPAPGAAPVLRPAVLLFHGCGGALGRNGGLSERLRTHIQLFHAQGWHVAALDALTLRGERELCTQRTGTRRVTQRDRRMDALQATQWLAHQPGVDEHRLAWMGWSNGGSTVLAASNRSHHQVAAMADWLQPRVRGVIAYYPGCESEARRGYRPFSETLLLLGLADDWTPAAACLPLASSAVQVRSWAGAYHGFDGTAPVRLRRDVPNGQNPGQGVHVGAHPEARAASREEWVRFLQRVWAPPAD